MAFTNQPGFLHDVAGPTRGTDREPARENSQVASTTLRISETFVSRQGEGRLTGTESFFVRTSGCNLRCWFCDTPYASWRPEGDRQTIDEIVAAIETSGVRHVVLTGGEPMLPDAIEPLCRMLHDRDYHITIETAGTIDRDVPCDLLSLSPKLESSTPSATEHPRWADLHDQRRMPIDVMRRLIDRAVATQVKFVIDSRDDFNECVSVAERLGVANEDVWIMPQGVTAKAMDVAGDWLRPWVAEQGYRYCDRMQIRWYGNRRGT